MIMKTLAVAVVAVAVIPDVVLAKGMGDGSDRENAFTANILDD